MELVLILVSCLLLTTGAASSSDAVRDVAGQELRRGHAYYVLPATSSNGGGLTIARGKNGSCPVNVIQVPFDVKKGRPVAFFPEEPQDDDVVRLGSQLYVMFPVPTHCPQSTVWQLDRKTGYVTTGGYVSHTDPHYSRFAIRKSAKPPGYVLVSDPCRFCRKASHSLGVVTQGGRRHLGPSSDHPLAVKFEKAEEAAVIESAVMRPN